MCVCVHVAHNGSGDARACTHVIIRVCVCVRVWTCVREHTRYSTDGKLLYELASSQSAAKNNGKPNCTVYAAMSAICNATALRNTAFNSFCTPTASSDQPESVSLLIV